MSPAEAENFKAIKDIEGLIVTNMNEVKQTVETIEGQIKEAGSASKENTEKLSKMGEEYNELYDRVKELEQKGGKMAEETAAKTLGDQFVEGDSFKQAVENRGYRANLQVKTAIINATGQNQPLVESDRLMDRIIHNPNRTLQIRDLIPTTRTGSNSIEFTRENVFTNNAGPQVGGSPEAFENVTKPESANTFTLVQEPVQTLAHFIPVSKQVMSDSPMLSGHINGRLMYGLKLVEENQLVTGSGANGNLNGVYTQATAFAQESPDVRQNRIDTVRSMIRQCEIANYSPDAVLMNPADWYAIDVEKVNAGTDDRYLVGNPRAISQPTLWGVPVIVTNAMTAGTAMVGAFQMGCEIYDREDASILISDQNQDNFEKNMLTLLAEERICLAVYNTSLFIADATFAATP